MAAYPRKQTLMIFIICALFVGGVAFYVYGQASTQSLGSSADMQVLTTASAQNAIATSTDWQKQFLNTPTSTAFKTPTASKNSAVFTEKTATDQLSDGFLQKYIQMSQAGLANDPKVAATAMGQVASSITSTLPTPEVYGPTDITSVTAVDKATLTAYQQKVTAIFKAYMPKENEAVIADQALSNDNMAALAQIDPIITSYKNIVLHLLKVPVPSPLVQKHLDLINGFSIAFYNAQALRHIDVDPVRGLAAISLEIGGMQNISAAASDIQTYLTAAGIPPSL